MVVEGATVTGFVTGTITMLALGLILSFFGISLMCWLIFTLAIYALPFFVGLTAGMAAFRSGAGIPAHSSSASSSEQWHWAQVRSLSRL